MRLTRHLGSVATLFATLACFGLAACGGSTSNSAVSSPGAGTVTVSWTVPTQNADGTASTDLSGYRVLYGSSPSSLTQSVEVAGASSTGKTISGLTAGTYYFAVVTVNSAGEASDPSNPASITVR